MSYRSVCCFCLVGRLDLKSAVYSCKTEVALRGVFPQRCTFYAIEASEVRGNQFLTKKWANSNSQPILFTVCSPVYSA